MILDIPFEAEEHFCNDVLPLDYCGYPQGYAVCCIEMDDGTHHNVLVLNIVEKKCEVHKVLFTSPTVQVKRKSQPAATACTGTGTAPQGTAQQQVDTGTEACHRVQAALDRAEQQQQQQEYLI